MKKNIIIAIVFLSLSILSIGRSAHAEPVVGFKAGNIISDSIMRDYQSMSVSNIQSFLEAKGASCQDGEARCIKNYTQNGKTAAQIIYDAAQLYKISPKVLLAMLQKESGLITISRPANWRYQSAAGYGCPDSTPGVCSDSYYGFENQINWMSKMFNAILSNSPNWYTPYIVGLNYIQYHPTTSCGGSNVYIENRATQALYNYTPYQPNSAALANKYTTGDSCSAYGNRNFFTFFTDWFGSTQGEDMTIRVVNAPNSPQYVIASGKKLQIPDPSVKIAWNLQRLPVIEVSAAELDSYPSSGTLSRSSKSEYTGQLYLIDGAKKYPASNQKDLLQFGYASAQPTPRYLIESLSNGTSSLNNFVSANGKNYLVQDGKYNEISSLTAVSLTKNQPIMPVEQTLLDTTLVQDPKTIDGFKFSSGENNYLISDNSSLQLAKNKDIFDVYPGTTNTLNSYTLSKFKISNSQTSQFVQFKGDQKVFLVQGSTLYHVPNIQYLAAWSPGYIATVTTLDSHFAGLFTSEKVLATHFAKDIDGTTYLINGNKTKVNPSLFNDSITEVLNIPYLSIFNKSSDDLNQIVTTADPGQVYLLNSSVLYPINTLESLSLWNGPGQKIGILPKFILDSFKKSTLPATSYFNTTNGKTWGFTDVKTLSELDDRSLAAWAINKDSIPTFSSDLVDYYLRKNTYTYPINFRTNPKNYCLVRSGGTWCTESTAVTNIWNAGNSIPFLHPLLLSKTIHPLGVFIESDQDPRIGISIIDSSKIFHIDTPNQVYTLGYAGERRVPVDSVDIASRAFSQESINYQLVRSPGSIYYALDGGKKRKVSNEYAKVWLGNYSAPTVSTEFLSLYPEASPMTRSFQATGDSRVYTVIDGKKVWITSLYDYAHNFMPYSSVSQVFRDSFVQGQNR